MPAPGAKEGIILVADDNEANRDLLVGLLGGEGYHVLSVTDGNQAFCWDAGDITSRTCS